jgi:hypothetical protein
MRATWPGGYRHPGQGGDGGAGAQSPGEEGAQLRQGSA